MYRKQEERAAPEATTAAVVAAVAVTTAAEVLFTAQARGILTAEATDTSDTIANLFFIISLLSVFCSKQPFLSYTIIRSKEAVFEYNCQNACSIFGYSRYLHNDCRNLISWITKTKHLIHK